MSNQVLVTEILRFPFLSLQVYTRLHYVSSDPGTEIGDMWRLRVCVCLERLLAVPHVSCMCRDPAQTKLGAGALRLRLSHYEVSVTLQSSVAIALHRKLYNSVLLCFFKLQPSSHSIFVVCLFSSMFLLVIATAYLEAQSIWEPFKRCVSLESNSTLETGRPFNLREIVQIHSESK